MIFLSEMTPKQLAAKRQEVAALLDKQGRKKLLRLVAVVAQHPAHRLDVHAVLQSYRGERMSHIVETNPGQPRPLQHPVEHMEYAVRRDGASGGRRK